MKLFFITIAMICGLQTAKADSVTLTSVNHCALEGEVNAGSMQELKLCLADKAILRRGRKYPIYLVINSGGGEIYSGIRFIEFAKTISNLQTVSIFAASMASAIVEALPGKRHITENGVLMFHRARGSFRGQFEDGEVESQLKLWKKIVRKMEKTNADRIGISLATYKSNVQNEWWVYAEENLVRNTADVVSVVKCSAKLLKIVKTEKVRSLFGTFEVKTSGCPLAN